MGLGEMLQPYQIGAISQASSKADENHQIPRPKLPLSEGLVKSEWNGCGGVVPILMNRHDHLILDCPTGKVEFGFKMLCSAVDDPFIGLMGDDSVNMMEQCTEFFFARRPIRIKNAQAAFCHRALGESVDPIPIHPHESTAIVSKIAKHKGVTQFVFAAEVGSNDAFFGPPSQDHGSGTVSKKDTCVSILIIGDG
jgi:hypothetical protein